MMINAPPFKIDLNHFIAANPGYICAKYADSSYITCSRAFLNITGFNSLSQIKGKTDFSMPWENLAKTYIEADKLALLDGQIVSLYEVKCKTKEHKLFKNQKFLTKTDSNESIIISSGYEITDPSEIVKYKLKTTLNVLTKREGEVLVYIIKGHSTKRIAKMLFCSPRTIETHTENIKYKLRCCRKSQIIDIINIPLTN